MSIIRSLSDESLLTLSEHEIIHAKQATRQSEQAQ